MRANRSLIFGDLKHRVKKKIGEEKRKRERKKKKKKRREGRRKPRRPRRVWKLRFLYGLSRLLWVGMNLWTFI